MSSGVKELSIQLDRIVAKAAKAEYVKEAGKLVHGQAVHYAPGNSGYLKQHIFNDFEEGHFSATAEIYTDVSYAGYVELGTGPKGAADHDGISPEVTPAYTMKPWWIHESMVDLWMAEQYHWPVINTPEGKFYRCSGQPAYPFMYPALKNNQREVIEIMKKGINNIFKEECK